MVKPILSDNIKELDTGERSLTHSILDDLYEWEVIRQNVIASIRFTETIEHAPTRDRRLQIEKEQLKRVENMLKQNMQRFYNTLTYKGSDEA